jgi:predicted nucleic acid-binding protein
MPNVITNTSPFLYLYRIGMLDLLPQLFGEEGLTENIEPLVTRLQDAGLWISDEIRQRVLTLAGEKKE